MEAVITPSLALAAPADPPDVRFRQFVQAYRTRAVGLAWRLCGGDAQGAEDIAQDAFLRAHRALPRFRSDARLETWFFRILIRCAHNHRRSQSRREQAMPPSVDSVSPPLPDPGLQQRIGLALDTLSRSQREAFVLVHLEGFTLAETAAILKRSTGTIKTHLHRALPRLRAELGDLEGTP
jgi:RNA polymerase sigma-70 factor (ECF subfamily)